jgi:hypothetical protein
MHRAGFSKTRSHPPLQIPAKADNQKHWKPARMVYYSMLPAGLFFLFISIYQVLIANQQNQSSEILSK